MSNAPAKPARSVPELIEDTRRRLASLEASLPRELDPAALSRSKLPFKPLSFAMTLAWRLNEVALSAMENFDRTRLVAAILLSRAAVETAAAQWYVTSKVVAAINANALGDLDDYLMKLAMGHKSSNAAKCQRQFKSDPFFVRSTM